MHAAKHNVLSTRLSGLLRKFVGVAAKISETNDFIALVMMTKNDEVAAEGLSGRGNASVHGVVGKY